MDDRDIEKLRLAVEFGLWVLWIDTAGHFERLRVIASSESESGEWPAWFTPGQMRYVDLHNVDEGDILVFSPPVCFDARISGS